MSDNVTHPEQAADFFAAHGAAERRLWLYRAIVRIQPESGGKGKGQGAISQCWKMPRATVYAMLAAIVLEGVSLDDAMARWPKAIRAAQVSRSGLSRLVEAARREFEHEQLLQLGRLAGGAMLDASLRAGPVDLAAVNERYLMQLAASALPEVQGTWAERENAEKHMYIRIGELLSAAALDQAKVNKIRLELEAKEKAIRDALGALGSGGAGLSTEERIAMVGKALTRVLHGESTAGSEPEPSDDGKAKRASGAMALKGGKKEAA